MKKPWLPKTWRFVAVLIVLIATIGANPVKKHHEENKKGIKNTMKKGGGGGDKGQQKHGNADQHVAVKIPDKKQNNKQQKKKEATKEAQRKITDFHSCEAGGRKIFENCYEMTVHGQQRHRKCLDGEVAMRRRDCLFLRPFANTELHILVEEPDAKALHADVGKHAGKVHQKDAIGAFVNAGEVMCCRSNADVSLQNVLKMVSQRLLLAKSVARYKFAKGISLETKLEQEQGQMELNRMENQAHDSGIVSEFARKFLENQQQAHRIIQKAYMERWKRHHPPEQDHIPDLATETQPALAAATTQLVLALIPLVNNGQQEKECRAKLAKLAKLAISEGIGTEPEGKRAIERAMKSICDSHKVASVHEDGNKNKNNVKKEQVVQKNGGNNHDKKQENGNNNKNNAKNEKVVKKNGENNNDMKKEEHDNNKNNAKKEEVGKKNGGSNHDKKTPISVGESGSDSDEESDEKNRKTNDKKNGQVQNNGKERHATSTDTKYDHMNIDKNHQNKTRTWDISESEEEEDDVKIHVRNNHKLGKKVQNHDKNNNKDENVRINTKNEHGQGNKHNKKRQDADKPDQDNGKVGSSSKSSADSTESPIVTRDSSENEEVKEGKDAKKGETLQVEKGQNKTREVRMKNENRSIFTSSEDEAQSSMDSEEEESEGDEDEQSMEQQMETKNLTRTHHKTREVEEKAHKKDEKLLMSQHNGKSHREREENEEEHGETHSRKSQNGQQHHYHHNSHRSEEEEEEEEEKIIQIRRRKMGRKSENWVKHNQIQHQQQHHQEQNGHVKEVNKHQKKGVEGISESEEYEENLSAESEEESDEVATKLDDNKVLSKSKESEAKNDKNEVESGKNEPPKSKEGPKLTDETEDKSGPLLDFQSRMAQMVNNLP